MDRPEGKAFEGQSAQSAFAREKADRRNLAKSKNSCLLSVTERHMLTI